MNKSITLLVFAFVACSSKTPVDMEEVLYDRSGQYITADNYNTSIIGFLYNQKVYNGPGFIRYRSGEKREQGPLKNGFKSGVWTGWDKKGKKSMKGNIKEENRMATGSVFILMVKRNMKAITSSAFRSVNGHISIIKELKL